MKPYFYKRCFAYFIDVIIVILISTLITSFIPVSEKAKNTSDDIMELTIGVSEEKISPEKYKYELENLNYQLTKETVMISLVNVVVYLLYFVVYPVYNNGQTVGKKMHKLKVVNKHHQEASTNNLLIRTLVLHGIAINIVSLVLVITLNKSSFITINNIFSYIQYLILIVTLFMVILRKNGRGLHDIIASTTVINEEERQ